MGQRWGRGVEIGREGEREREGEDRFGDINKALRGSGIAVVDGGLLTGGYTRPCGDV